MTRGIGDLLGALQLLLPPWAVAAVLGFVALLVLPFWLRSMKGKQIRGLVRRMVRAEPEERERLTRRVLEIAGRSGLLLFTLATEAEKRAQHGLRREALTRLEGVGGYEAELALLRAKTEREVKRGGHPLEELVIIERLAKEGMASTAQMRLDEALRRFPEHPDLLAARARLGQ